MFEIAAFLFWFIVIFFMIAIIVITPVLNVIALICVIAVGGLIYQGHRQDIARAAKHDREQQAYTQQWREQREQQIALDQEQARLQEKRLSKQTAEREMTMRCEHPHAIEWYADCRERLKPQYEREMALRCASANAAEHFVSCLEWQRTRP